MDRELLNLLELIEQSDYVTAEQLAQHIQKSEKTTRARLKALRQNLAESGAELVSKPRHGYRLEIKAYNALPATRLKPPKSVLCIS